MVNTLTCREPIIVEDEEFESVLSWLKRDIAETICERGYASFSPPKYIWYLSNPDGNNAQTIEIFGQYQADNIV